MGCQVNRKAVCVEWLNTLYDIMRSDDLLEFKVWQGLYDKPDLKITNLNWGLAHIAAWYDCQSIMSYLVETNHYSVNQIDDASESPLHISAYTGGIHTTKLLVK
jgi:hypothetical protein